MAKLPAGATIESSGGVKLPAGATIESPEETAETKDSYFRGLTQFFAKGVSMGFNDEITAALTAIPAAISTGTTVSEAFNSILDAERMGMEQFAEENPKTAFATEVVGGLATGGVGASKIAGAKIFQGGKTVASRAGKKLSAQAATAAPLGALYGAGESEGGITDRLEGAAKGAAIATVAAPLVVAGVGTVTKAGRGFANLFKRSETRALDNATKQIARAVQRDGDTIEDIAQRTKNLGDEARPVDAGGVNVKRELERAASVPGRAPEMTERSLITRLSRQGVRIQQVFDRYIGRNNVSATKTVSGLSEDAAERARPHYDKAYETIVNNKDARLEALLANPRIQKAIPKAIERIKSKTADDDDMLRVLQSELDPENPNMILWDHVKRQLDDDASVAFRAGAGDLGKDIVKNSQTLRKALDNQSPDYAKARSIWSGSKRAEEAFKDGLDFLKGLNNPLTGAAAKAEKFAELSEAEKALFRKGVSMAVKQLVRTAGDSVDGTPPASLMKKIYGNKEARFILNKVIPDQKGRNELSKALRAENEFRKTTNEILGNSKTALRQELLKENAAVIAEKAQAGINMLFAIRGSFFAMGRAIQTVVGKGPPSEKANEKVAEKLLAKGEASIDAVLKDVNRYLTLPDATNNAVQRLMKVPKGERLKFLKANPQVKKEIDRSVSALVAGIYASGKVKPDQEEN